MSITLEEVASKIQDWGSRAKCKPVGMHHVRQSGIKRIPRTWHLDDQKPKRVWVPYTKEPEACGTLRSKEWCAVAEACKELHDDGWWKCSRHREGPATPMKAGGRIPKVCTNCRKNHSACDKCDKANDLATTYPTTGGDSFYSYYLCPEHKCLHYW